jgi:urate oxidase
MSLVQQKYGKDKVRVVKVIHTQHYHYVVELVVQVLLSGSSFTTSYTMADNSKVVPTDTVKNTVYYLAHKHNLESIESFGGYIISHFLTTYAHVDQVHVKIQQISWERIKTTTDKEVSFKFPGTLVPNDLEFVIPHKHSFVKGSNEKRCFNATGSRQSQGFTLKSTSGIQDMTVLKTTGSSFENFHLCPLTTLKNASDRLFSTTVECTYSWPTRHFSYFAALPWNPNAVFANVKQLILDIFANHNSPSVQNTLYLICEQALKVNPDIEQLDVSLPNSHVFVFDLERFGVTDNATGNGGTYYPVSDPSGLIQASITRIKSKI